MYTSRQSGSALKRFRLLPTRSILTPEEVGRLLHIHPKTVNRMAREGEIPGFKLGKYWRFLNADLDHYITQLAQQYTISNQKRRH